MTEHALAHGQNEEVLSTDYELVLPQETTTSSGVHGLQAGDLMVTRSRPLENKVDQDLRSI